MRHRSIPLSRPRRFLIDLLRAAARVPTVPVQRVMDLGPVADARRAAPGRPGWPALFVRAFARVAAEVPPLRRAYVRLPWPRLVEYPKSVAAVAVEREYGGEPYVFFGRLWDPAALPVAEIHARIRRLAETPVEEVPSFRAVLAAGGWPGPVRRALLWLALNLSRVRPGRFGTFGLSVYSSLGAESLHPLSPLTATLNYGVVGSDGRVSVRLVADARVVDGPTAARALVRLEEVLCGPVLAELRGLTSRAA